MSVDIVVPFYNTKEHIFEIFQENMERIVTDGQLKHYRIILVNDGSKTKTHQKFIEKWQLKFGSSFQFIDLKDNKGKGGAIKEGMKYSENDYAIFYDIDFPFGLQALYKMYDKLSKSDSQIIIARRDGSYFRKLPLKRKFISFIVKSFAFVFSKGSIKDSQAGLKGMKREVVPILLATESNSFIMDFEFLLKSARRDLKMSDIMVSPNDEIEFTNFSNAILKNELNTLLKIIIKKLK